MAADEGGDQGEPQRVRPMFRLKHDDVVLISHQPVTGPDLEDFDRELVPLDPQRDRGAQDTLCPTRTVESHRVRAILETHRSQETGQTQHVIGVIVGEEDFGEGEPNTVPHHLALAAFSTVEQNGFALTLHRDPGHVPVHRGDGCAGAEEREGQHGLTKTA